MPNLGGIDPRNMKIFGGGAAKSATIERHTFGLKVDRNGVDEIHKFTVAPRLTIAEMILAVASQSGNGLGAVEGILRMVKRNLVNDDGVPAKWSPEPLPQDTTPAMVVSSVEGWPEASGELATVEQPEREEAYRGPDGAIYPLSDEQTLAKFSAYDAGSSRRRWIYLIEQDDDVTVDADDLVEMSRWLIGLAANRPTEPSGR